MKKYLFILLLLITTGLFAQDIRNKIGNGGKFIVEDDDETLVTVDESNGDITVNGDINANNLPTNINSLTKDIQWGDAGSSPNRSATYTGNYAVVGPILIQWGTFNITGPSSISDIHVELPTNFGDGNYSLSYSGVSVNDGSVPISDHETVIGRVTSKESSKFILRSKYFDGRDINFIAIGVAL